MTTRRARCPGFILLTALASVVLGTAALLGHLDHPREQAGRSAPSRGWVGSWSAAQVGGGPEAAPGRGHPGLTVRNVVHVSVGGSAARIHLSNAFGNRPLRVLRCTVALAARPSGPAAAAGTLRVVRFGGHGRTTVSPGASTVSDPVRLLVPPAADLLVTVHAPLAGGTVTHHPFARQTSYLARGDHSGESGRHAFTARTSRWRYVSGVDVWNREVEGAVVVLGDSITDGLTSTPDANHRWTDFLAVRLLTSPDAPRLGVLNQGVSGNRVLRDADPGVPSNGPSGLRRLRRDALGQTGAAVLVVELGTNDILKVPRQADARRIVRGLREITTRGRQHGLRVVGATLPPFRGHQSFGPEPERVRQEVNARIRGGSVFDAVLDFDRALRDPAAPTRLAPRYDSGDHLHPNDAGYRAMAGSVDLDVLRSTSPALL